MGKIANKEMELKFKRLKEINSVYSDEKRSQFDSDIYRIVSWFLNNKKLDDLYVFVKENNFSEEFIDELKQTVHFCCYRLIVDIKQGSEIKQFFCIPMAIPIIINLDKDIFNRFNFCFHDFAKEIIGENIIKNWFSLKDNVILIMDKYLYPGNTSEWTSECHVRDYVEGLVYSKFCNKKQYTPLIDPPFKTIDDTYRYIELNNVVSFVRFLSLVFVVDIFDNETINQVRDLFFISKDKIKNEWLDKFHEALMYYVQKEYNPNYVNVLAAKPVEFDNVPYTNFFIQRYLDIFLNIENAKKILKTQYLGVKSYITVKIHRKEDDHLAEIEIEICNEANQNPIYFFSFPLNLQVENVDLLGDILAAILTEFNVIKLKIKEEDRIIEKIDC